MADRATYSETVRQGVGTGTSPVLPVSEVFTGHGAVEVDSGLVAVGGPRSAGSAAGNGSHYAAAGSAAGTGPHAVADSRVEKADGFDPRTLRIGLGYDVHALISGRDLVIGGVAVPHEKGLDGHSDADVLAHAIADAVLGALRAGDIGKLFPDTDPAYAGADSLKLLADCASLARREGYEIIDVDSVVAAQVPRLSPYREQMRMNLSKALGIEAECVGVKATTTERLGFEGREEGISATAVCLLCRCSTC